MTTAPVIMVRAPQHLLSPTSQTGPALVSLTTRRASLGFAPVWLHVATVPSDGSCKTNLTNGLSPTFPGPVDYWYRFARRERGTSGTLDVRPLFLSYAVSVSNAWSRMCLCADKHLCGLKDQAAASQQFDYKVKSFHECSDRERETEKRKRTVRAQDF